MNHLPIDLVDKWDLRFLALADHVGQWSKDPSTKVGSVIVDPMRRVVSMGYNGLAQGVEDSPERLNNRETKYKVIIHSEQNSLIFAQRSVVGCTIYTNPLMPCARCASMIIQAGITRVVAPLSDNSRWLEDFILAGQMFDEAGVIVDIIDMAVLPSIYGSPEFSSGK